MAEDVIDADRAVVEAVVEGVDVSVEDVLPGAAGRIVQKVAQRTRAVEVQRVAVGERVLADEVVDGEGLSFDALAEGVGRDPAAVGGLTLEVDDRIPELIPEPARNVLDRVDAIAVDLEFLEHPLRPAKQIAGAVVGDRVARLRVGRVVGPEVERDGPAAAGDARVVDGALGQVAVGVGAPIGGIGTVEVGAAGDVLRVVGVHRVADELVVGALIDVDERDEVAAVEVVVGAVGVL